MKGKKAAIPLPADAIGDWAKSIFKRFLLKVPNK